MSVTLPLRSLRQLPLHAVRRSVYALPRCQNFSKQSNPKFDRAPPASPRRESAFHFRDFRREHWDKPKPCVQSNNCTQSSNIQCYYTRLV